MITETITAKKYYRTLPAQAKVRVTVTADPTIDPLGRARRIAKACEPWVVRALRFAGAVNTLRGVWDLFWRRSCTS